MNNQELNNLKQNIRDLYEQILALQISCEEKKEDLLLDKYTQLLQNTQLIIEQNNKLFALVGEVLNKMDSCKEQKKFDDTIIQHKEIKPTESVKQEESVRNEQTEKQCIETEQEELPEEKTAPNEFTEEKENESINYSSSTQQQTEAPKTSTHKETSSVLEFLHTRVIKDSKESENTTKAQQEETASQRLNNLLSQNEKKQADQTSIIEEQAIEQNSVAKPKSISDKFEAANKTNLNFTIGMNYKFMFINDLFAGNVQAYENFINELNAVSTLKDSMQIINSARTRYKWATTSVAYNNLTEIIQQRFE